MNKREIIFYAPFDKGIPLVRIGGAEMGCLKTKEVYEKAGITVRHLNKPVFLAGKIRFFIGMMLVPFKLFIKILKYPNAPVHIVGYYCKIAKYEWFLTRMCIKLGRRTIYEPRNGNMVQSYEEGSPSYKRTLKNLLLKPDVVLCQGKEYVDFIKEQWGVERSYYPNYIMEDYVKINKTERPHPLRLIYFGRVSGSKRIDIVLHTLYEVRKKGIDAYLDIIGAYDDEYKQSLEGEIKKLGIAKHVIFYGRQDFCFIYERLIQSHYFIFPSQNKAEGHSNSLTEAMGCGVVPIVSPAGFNASVCGFPELVIRKADPKLYAEKIIEIEKKGLWEDYSNKVFERTRTMYTSSVVGEKLISYVEPLFD